MRVAGDAADEGAAEPIDRERPGHLERLASAHVGLDLLVGDLGEAHPGRGRAGDPDLPVGVDHAVAGVQRPGASAHVLPASGRLGCRPGLAQDPAVELEHGVAADHQGSWLVRRHRHRLELRELERVRRGLGLLDAVLVDARDHDVGAQPGTPQGLQPGGRRRGQDQPGERSGHGSPLARHAPGPWRSVVRTLRAGADHAGRRSPGALLGPGGRHRRDDRDQRRHLLVGGVGRQDAQQWRLAGSTTGSRPLDGRVLGRHSGMFPCFLGGSVSRLERSRRSALTTSARVSCGVITAST